MNACEQTQMTTLLDRLAEGPERLTVVTGLRQTGQTMLVRLVGQRSRGAHNRVHKTLDRCGTCGGCGNTRRGAARNDSPHPPRRPESLRISS